MKSTGVTRRIDELGRVVIPKELRRILSIRDGENLEIYIEDDKIILKKYLMMKSLAELSEKLIDIFTAFDDSDLIITDREKIISSSYNYKQIINTKINSELIKYIDNRESVSSVEKSKINLENSEIIGYISIVPIINDTDCLGLVILIKKDNTIQSEDIKINKIIAKILSEKININ